MCHKVLCIGTDRLARPNSADLDQTAPLGSGSTLFAIPPAPFGRTDAL